MTVADESGLVTYYEHVHDFGHLPTLEHAHRWSNGVLGTLGVSLDGGTKRSLARALPKELSDQMKSIFWLLHFRDSNLSLYDFQTRVARRSGNSDPEFALKPVKAVFSALNLFLNQDLHKRVAESLPPEIRMVWQESESLAR